MPKGIVHSYFIAFLALAKYNRCMRKFEAKDGIEGMESTKNRAVIVPIVFLFVLLAVLAANHLSYGAYKRAGLLSVVPLDAWVFLCVGMVLLGVSCFVFLQLFDYKTGKLFAFYTLLLGLSISLAPCNRLHQPVVALMRMACTFSSSLLLFQLIGCLTLCTKSAIFRVLGAVLVPALLAQLYVDMNACVFIAALFSLVLMLANHKASNCFAKKQVRALMMGIGAGAVLFVAAWAAPNIYLVQPSPQMQPVIELSFLPMETIADSLALLLLSAVSIAIMLTLIRREFALKDARLKLGYFVALPLYVLVPTSLLLAYAHCPLWLLMVISLCLLAPPVAFLLVSLHTGAASIQHSAYQWRLIEEIEKEKQELSGYLHDEVLQSLIAFYRQIQSDDAGRYADMKAPLSALIAQIRRVSHNLYPTMVEDLGLEQSLQIFSEELQQSHRDIRIVYDYGLCSGILPKALSLALYRITKELATNAAKHAQASVISLLLSQDQGGYCIVVQDNGKGFALPDEKMLLQSPHMGLCTVKSQVAKLQGQIRFQSEMGAGTNCRVYLPKEVTQCTKSS